MPERFAYTIAGNVLASPDGIYIRRKADDDLLKCCLQRDYAYVLAPRQVGKSSLVTSTINQLKEHGIRSCSIDLNEIGTDLQQEQWYLGQLVSVQDKLGLQSDAIDWWSKPTTQSLGVPQRMVNFYKTVLLKEITGRVVIFIDEIENTRSLKFTDDFYGGIRSLHNGRASDQKLNRLSFVLVGSARPNDLIQDPKRAPFNIAQAVEVTDFTLSEAQPLADGFGLPRPHADHLLAWIIKWTGGHPYLTQRICRAVVDENTTRWSEDSLDKVVAKTFFGDMMDKDNNLQVVRDMLTRTEVVDRVELLKTYADIYRKSPVVRDDERSAIKAYLKLVGVVHRQKMNLGVRNKIYRKVFNGQWVKKSLATV